MFAGDLFLAPLQIPKFRDVQVSYIKWYRHQTTRILLMLQMVSRFLVVPNIV
jgi:hypothetical protein